MWRAAPAKAANISRGQLSKYRSSSALNGGGRPFAIARAIRLAYSSVGDGFGWALLIAGPSANHATVVGVCVAALSKSRNSHLNQQADFGRYVRRTGRPPKTISYDIGEWRAAQNKTASCYIIEITT